MTNMRILAAASRHRDTGEDPEAMTTRRAVTSLAVLLLTAGACGRSGAPRPTGETPTQADTLAERLLRDSLTRASEDSIRALGAAPAAAPVLPAPTLAPKKESAAAPERRCVLDLPNTPSTHGPCA